jgi:lysophospholipase L1-like esterase
MIRHLVRAGCAALTLLALVNGAPAAASGAPPARYYLALGDSIAYGFQTAKALAGLPPEAFDTGYVDLVAARLGRRSRVVTVNYACPGESTVSFRVSCVWKDTGHRLHDDYSGAQRSAALAFLHRYRPHVALITLSLNGNDINDFVHSCAGDVQCVQRGAPAAIAQYAARLRSILVQLRAAAPGATIVVVGAYNPNVGAFELSDPLFASLNAAQAAAARAVRARFADPFPVFNPAADETATICTLTLICTAGDSHPSDAGYRALADVVWRAAGRGYWR